MLTFPSLLPDNFKIDVERQRLFADRLIHRLVLFEAWIQGGARMNDDVGRGHIVGICRYSCFFKRPDL